jgi:hypothetical protein
MALIVSGRGLENSGKHGKIGHLDNGIVEVSGSIPLGSTN